MFWVDTAAQDFEAVSAFVMPTIFAVSGSASTAVVGLYLVRSVLERTYKEFLSRCVGRLVMKTVKASRGRESRQHREPPAGIVHVPWLQPGDTVLMRKEEICLVALSCNFALDVIFLSMEY